MIRSVMFDFGGVITSSPFDAFGRYERQAGLPDGFIRSLNATDPDTNAWAQLERGDVSFDRFCELYEAEARARGHRIDARQVMAGLGGEVRPQMAEAVRFCAARFKTACLTNNFATFDLPERPQVTEVFALFDVVLESRKLGIRKPDPRFYAMACETLAVEPAEVVYLDDLGINLKPARQMGMHTIKVVDPLDALTELYSVVGASEPPVP